MCFLAFLKQTRKLLAWRPNPENMLYIVIGNESCDLDSAVSAITLAFLLKHSRKDKDFLPVLNIPRKDFALKTEVSHLFDQVNIKPIDLTFRDELTDLLIANSHFILVDHHESPFADRVDEVYDHRPYNRDKDCLPSHCKRTIEPVGSCATLIAEQLFNCPENSSNVDSKISCTLLHRTIVLDTVNFSTTANRATDKDRYMVEKLEKVLPGAFESRNIIFDELVSARSDVSQLSANQLLLKDMKVIEAAAGSKQFKLALPGFPISVQMFIKKPNADAAVRELAAELNCTAIVLIGMYVEQPGNTVHRDIGIIPVGNKTEAQQLCDEIQTALLASEQPRFGFDRIKNTDFLSGTFFVQNNVTVTRKHVLPICQKALEKWAANES